MLNIAVIITCFNRKDKTLSCLHHLFVALDEFNSKTTQKINLQVYLTDDGCTDGTAEAVIAQCEGKAVHIVKGDGNCYWAGGMRLAWREAMRHHDKWDFYLLLNDDTIVKDNVFDELLECHYFALKQYGQAGVYSGCTCSSKDVNHITYSGDVMNPDTHGWNRLLPNGKPQMVDMTNANILLVANSVVDMIGIFPECYVHDCADQDYGLTARRHSLPVLITSHTCGICEYDHTNEADVCRMLMSMSLNERKKYVFHPTHSDKDYLWFIKRNMPNRYAVSWIMRKIRLYLPGAYYRLCKMRGIY